LVESKLVLEEGKGVKGDPRTYRRAVADSIPFQSPPLGEEPNSIGEEADSAGVDAGA
jgi:hypothetical protein